MDVACCCGTTVAATAETCPACATSVGSLKGCARHRTPATSTVGG